MLLALLPAHNEEAVIADAIRSLQTQTMTVDEIVVVADNCTDRTVEIALELGVGVFETKENRHVKAGGLNQILAKRLRAMNDDDMILVMDADGTLDEGFVEGAVKHVLADDDMGAVGGTFRGMDGGGLVGHLQRNEYARYGRDVRRLNGKCLVVTGTAAVFRASTLRRVSEARLDGELPTGDGKGGIYDTTVLTEDNELTFALLHLGYKVLSPPECTLSTEVMPTWRQLWNQRLRWKRGAIENCFQYGITRITWKYWGRQVMTAAGIAVTVLYLSALLISIAFGDGVNMNSAWMWVTVVFIAERVITVRDRGAWRMLAAATMYEIVYDLYLQLVHTVAYFDVAFSKKRSW